MYLSEAQGERLREVGEEDSDDLALFFQHVCLLLADLERRSGVLRGGAVDLVERGEGLLRMPPAHEAIRALHVVRCTDRDERCGLEPEGPPGGPIRAVTDVHRVRDRGALEPLGDGDRAADRRPRAAVLARHRAHHLARIDADAQRQPDVVPALELLVLLREGVEHRLPRCDRGHRARLGGLAIEDGPDSVTDVFVDGPAVAADLM